MNNNILRDSAYGEIACICYGDNNVFYQSILTLISVKKHNEYVHCFICTCEENLSNNDYELLNRYDIKLFPINDSMRKNLDKFDFDTGRWSKMIMLKFFLPTLFDNSEYDYLIILDSDMLCVGAFDLEEMLPINRFISWRRSGFLPERFTKENWKIVAEHFHFSEDWFHQRKYFIPNGGFFAIALKNSWCNEMYKEIVDIANYISSLTKGAIDETAMAIYCWRHDLEIKRVPECYNCPIVNRIISDNIKIIHFSGSPKLWQVSRIRKLIDDKLYNSFSLCLFITSFIIYFNCAKDFNLHNLIFRDEYLSDSTILTAISKQEHFYLNNLYKSPFDIYYLRSLIKRKKYEKAADYCEQSVAADSKITHLFEIMEYYFLAGNILKFLKYYNLLCGISCFDINLINKLFHITAYIGNFDEIKNNIVKISEKIDDEKISCIFDKLNIMESFPKGCIGTWHGTVIVWDNEIKMLKHSDDYTNYIQADINNDKISLYIKSINKYIQMVTENNNFLLIDEKIYYNITEYKINNFDIICDGKFLSARPTGNFFFTDAPREWERFYLVGKTV